MNVFDRAAKRADAVFNRVFGEDETSILRLANGTELEIVHGVIFDPMGSRRVGEDGGYVERATAHISIESLYLAAFEHGCRVKVQGEWWALVEELNRDSARFTALAEKVDAVETTARRGTRKQF